MGVKYNLIIYPLFISFSKIAPNSLSRERVFSIVYLHLQLIFITPATTRVRRLPSKYGVQWNNTALSLITDKSNNMTMLLPL